MSFDPAAVAGYIAEAHAQRRRFENVPPSFGMATIAQAYAAQDALARVWEPVHGPVAGMKIATTTKVMQALMGIDHPCAGLILERRIHTSPGRIKASDHQHMVVECELAVRLARDLPGTGTPYTRADVRSAVGSIAAAFELIEDRHADYKSTAATSLIADAAWNAGIVLGPEHPLPPDFELDGRGGHLTTSLGIAREGKTDDPLGALAWLADTAVTRGRPLRAGMVVITGSVIPTLPIAVGETFTFTLDGAGSVAMTCTA
jgi:2-oxo-3-hexenedioate decarboxylase/2-keto-4-pentenoate hydratase